MHQHQVNLYNNYQTTNSVASTSTTARNQQLVSNQMYSLASQANTNLQFNEAFFFSNSTPSSSSSSSSSASTASNQDTNTTTNYDYFNQQTQPNDSDALIADLEYLFANNSTTTNTTTNHNQTFLHSTSIRNKMNVNLQRPPPLSTPAIHHPPTLNNLIYNHNLLLDDDQINPSTTLDSIILPDNNHQTYYSIDQIETQRFSSNEFLNEPVQHHQQQQQHAQLQNEPLDVKPNYSTQFNSITQSQPISSLDSPKPKLKSNKKRNVKDILQWPVSTLLSPKIESDTYLQQPSRKKLKQNESFDDEKYKKSDEFKCWVCGDKSSGNHYGALTCEACKLFFRRHSTLSTTNTTSESKSDSSPTSTTSSTNEIKIMQQCAKRNCQITPNTRGACPECRYRKCIAVGMGLNRTTFGRHTTNQKLRYNSRVTDLFSEIMKLFIRLKTHLDIVTLKIKSLNSQQQLYLSSGLYLIPLNTSSLNTMNIIENKSEFEKLLIKFYNDVIELIIPNTTKNDLQHPNEYYYSKTKLTSNILVAFCIIFGYNLRINNTHVHISLNQLQHICKQMKEIDIEFKTVPQRIKIIYFLLIMYNSFSVNSLDESDQVSVSHSHSNKLISNYLQATQPNTMTNLTNRLYDDYIDDSFNIQRSLIDLLNSELYFQQNNLSSTRVSLLLKLDQFV